LKDVTLQPCGFTPDMTCLRVPSLPAASIGLEDEQHRPLVLRVEFVLQFGQYLDAPRQRFLRPRLVLVFELQRVAGVNVFEPELAAVLDAKRPREFVGPA